MTARPGAAPIDLPATHRMRTRGQATAVAAVRAMLANGVPHAILLAGPAGTGKTTLALDLAAALLCTAPVAEERPCGECRGCRMVDHGNHPDLHRLAPVGAGSLIPIGGRDDRGVRDLVGELALLPVEGGARVAVVEAAHRMTEDAQSAFLKTLEEPPSRSTIILCADEEERLLPTIRSRCVRVRLGPVPVREIAAILDERGLADAVAGSRLARLADGRPGTAIAYALAPDAGTIRSEITRTLLDLLSAGRTRRLVGVRDLAGRAADLVRALDLGMARASTGSGDDEVSGAGRGRRSRAARAGGEVAASRRSAGALAGGDGGLSGSDGAGDGDPGDIAELGPGKVPASERRRAALALVAAWRTLLRDVALVGLGDASRVTDTDLLEDLAQGARLVPPDDAAAFLRRLEAAGEQLEGNVSPELVLDVLALRWQPATPMRGAVAGRGRAAGERG